MPVDPDIARLESNRWSMFVRFGRARGLKSAIGDLDRIAGWATVSGFVNAEPGYAETTRVLNPFSDLVLDGFGPDIGASARTAIGVAALPLNLPLVVSAEVELS